MVLPDFVTVLLLHPHDPIVLVVPSVGPVIEHQASCRGRSGGRGESGRGLGAVEGSVEEEVGDFGNLRGKEGRKGRKEEKKKGERGRGRGGRERGMGETRKSRRVREE